MSFLLRHGLSYPGTNWSKPHHGRLADLSFPEPAQQLVLEELVQRIERAEAFCARLADAIADLLPRWTLAPVVEALQALRGVSMLNAATLVAEIGCFDRFDNPRQPMGYLGLVPSEHSSGKTVRRGPITKTGNSLARTSLIEAAWTYRFPARISRIIHKQSAHLPDPIRAAGWKA